MADPDATHQGLAGHPVFRGHVVARRGQQKREEGPVGAHDPPLHDPGSLTYEPGFGLREKPFSLSSDPRFFFKNSSNGPTFDALLRGIQRREGILALTGEVGSGKTTLCRAVFQSLDRKTLASFVPDPFLSREDLLKTLLVDFGVVSVEDIRNGRLRGVSHTDLSYLLVEFLTSLQPLQAFAVVMIDEAQNLPSTLLEEIRVLCDLENRQKLLQLVLAGQPELRSRLGTFDMRHLTERLSVQCELPPLAPKDVGPYVSHRLMIAGNNITLQFTDAAIDLVCAASSGIPRVINRVCDRALARAAHAATMKVDAEHVLGAIDDLRLPIARLRSPVLERSREASLPVDDPTLNGAGGQPGATVGSPFPNGHMLEWDSPRSALESFDREWSAVSAGREEPQPRPLSQSPSSSPAAAPLGEKPGT